MFKKPEEVKSNLL